MRRVLFTLMLSGIALQWAACSANDDMQSAKLERGHRAEARAARFAALDSDRDGKLSLVEFQVVSDRMFDRIDADKNGVITRAEFDRPPPFPEGRPRPPGPMGAPGMAPPPPRADGTPRPSFAERFAQRREAHFVKLDVNGDGQISRDEMRAQAAEMLKRMDRNGDGYLTMDEMRPPRGMHHRGEKPEPS